MASSSCLTCFPKLAFLERSAVFASTWPRWEALTLKAKFSISLGRPSLVFTSAKPPISHLLGTCPGRLGLLRQWEISSSGWWIFLPLCALCAQGMVDSNEELPQAVPQCLVPP